MEISNFGQGADEEIATYPHPNVRLVNGQPSYLHTDQLGSVRLITGAAGTAAKETLYKPFGETTDWVADPAEAVETKGFIGERYDADAGLQYLNARYYDPKLGMFIQPDWFEVTEPGVGTNRYAYAGQDPINGADPGGNGFWSDLGDSLRDSWDAVRDWASGNVDRSVRGNPLDGPRGIGHANGASFSCFGCGGTGFDALGALDRAVEYDDYIATGVVARGSGGGSRRGSAYSASAQLRRELYYFNINSIQIHRARVGLGPMEYVVPTNFTPTLASIARLRQEVRTLKALPANYGATLARIRAGTQDVHRNDGTVFYNREGRLPSRPDGYYAEYVVRTPGIVGAGARRIVTGRGGEIYYTGNHYQTFVRAPGW